MYPGTHAATMPDKPAMVMAETGDVLTYGELDRRSNQLAHLFRAEGLEPGDHIAVLAENHPDFVVTCWAAQRSGLYFTAVNWHLTADEAAYVIDDCGAGVLVISSTQRELAQRLVPATPKVRRRLTIGEAFADHEHFDDALAAYPTARIDDEVEGADMLYTSGTTGRPKGVRSAMGFGTPTGQPHPQAATLRVLYGVDESTVYLSTAPLYHAAPLVFTLGVHRLGGTVVAMEHFDPAMALRLIEEHGVTHSQWVPTMFVRMLRLPADDRERFSSETHRMAVHAAAPCPIHVKEQMIDWWGPILYEYYGGTERNGLTFIDSDSWLTHRGSVGRPIGCTVHIVDDDGVEVPTGEVGTVYFESGLEFEYHGDPEKTRSTRHPKGWTTLGDVGYLDDDGFLYLTDRKAHMIVSGGVNIYPQEIEDVLIGHPGVADAAVIGVPNEEFGEEVKAVVELTPDYADRPDVATELIDYCRSHLARFKCPRTVDVVEALPRDPNGKLYKRRLRDTYWAGHTSRVV